MRQFKIYTLLGSQDKNLPQQKIAQFESISGGFQEWKKYIDKLSADARKNSHLFFSHLKFFALEIEIYRLLSYFHMNGTIKKPEKFIEAKAVNFIYTIVDISESLSNQGKHELKRRIQGILKSREGLNPLHHEVQTLIDLYAKDYEIFLNDFDKSANKSSRTKNFDFLARKKGVEWEVECKSVGPDSGEPVRIRQLNHLSAALEHKKVFSRAIDKYTHCLLLIEVFIEGRLEGNELISSIANDVSSAIENDVNQEKTEYQINLRKIPIDDLTVGHCDDIIGDKISEYVQVYASFDSRGYISSERRGNNVVAVVIGSKRKRMLFRNLTRQIKESYKKQLSKKRLSVVIINFDYLSPRNMRRFFHYAESNNREHFRHVAHKVFESLRSDSLYQIIFASQPLEVTDLDALTKKEEQRIAYWYYNPYCRMPDIGRFGLI